ncbi:uncharacterized protein LOC123265491 [Cotesia glomerata]|uniref:uncharacterized protein LOC123265491 n=1 Tax=Cotesia glomerata TaxID=32391 RepID=UPI001D01DC6A|nr:uncharacterized protein LOC123265491 [Cotesia glomerata]
MLNNNSLKSLLIEDIAFRYDWSDTDSEGYDGDTEELLDNFHKILVFKSTADRDENNLQFVSDENSLNDDSISSEPLTDDVINQKNVSSKDENSVTECFFKFFTEDILKAIVECTNTHIAESKNNFSRERDCQDINIEELRVVIDLLILTGLFKLNSNLDDLWEKGGIGVELFRLTMNLKRFKFILRYLHFSIYSNCESIKLDNNPNKMEEIIETFRKNCKENFDVGKSITISRKLLTHKSDSDRAENKVDLSSGLMIYYTMDTDYYYISRLEFYDKKNFNRLEDSYSNHQDALYFLLKLYNENINVVLDESCKMLDLILKNSDFVCHVDTEKVNLFMTDDILNKYTVFGQTKKLVLKLLFFMIDIACLDSFVIYHVNFNNNLSRKQFLKKLGLALVIDHIKMRATSQYLPRELRAEACIPSGSIYTVCYGVNAV